MESILILQFCTTGPDPSRESRESGRFLANVGIGGHLEIFPIVPFESLFWLFDTGISKPNKKISFKLPIHGSIAYQEPMSDIIYLNIPLCASEAQNDRRARLQKAFLSSDSLRSSTLQVSVFRSQTSVLSSSCAS
jgi:hypothetical protein